MRLPVTNRGAVTAIVLVVAASASAREWPEGIFRTKPSATRSFAAVTSSDPNRARTVIGAARFFQVEKNDTLLDIGRYYDLGYNEITEANRGVDPWIPKPGHMILLPSQWILPESDYKGVVLNIPEMRLYYFQPGHGDTVTATTFPVGLGRDDWRTPRARFRIGGKTVNPTWIPTESIKAEHRREGRPVPDAIPGGAPDNPLGKYRLRLTLPLYGIHGTNIPWGVGMQVSHGCVRLYPEDIERLFPIVAVGTPGQFVYQPVKVGLRDGRVFVEVHKDIYGFTPGPYREAVRLIEKLGVQSRVNFGRVKSAVLAQSGVPTDVTIAPGDDLRDEFLGSSRPPQRTRPDTLPGAKSR